MVGITDNPELHRMFEREIHRFEGIDHDNYEAGRRKIWRNFLKYIVPKKEGVSLRERAIETLASELVGFDGKIGIVRMRINYGYHREKYVDGIWSQIEKPYSN